MKPLSIEIYNQKALKTGKIIKLNPAIFSVEASPALIQRAVVAQRANSRKSIAHTKTKGEVRGGGKKPWKQKGTGRARHGSIRSPLWRGGGVTFGPRNTRNFSKKINKKAKRKALFTVLSDKVKNDVLIVLDKLDFQEAKTKDMNIMLEKFYKIFLLKDKKQNSAIILDQKSKRFVQALKNITHTQTIAPNSLNVVDLLSCKILFVTLKALREIEEIYYSIEK